MKKRMVLVSFIGALLLMTVGVFANAGVRLRANVPFAFYVDKEVLPAGEYLFEMGAMTPHSATSSAVVIRKVDGTMMTWIATMPGEEHNRQADDRLVFNQYGDKYFLSKVKCLEYQADLRTGKAEKEMIALGARSTGSRLIAAK